jgi:two-component system heavy metal sensor histidine kinase CusS
MLIRYKLILNFSLLVGALFIAFSIAIYTFYDYGKEKLFRSRLKNKAISTAQIFHNINILDEIALKSLTKQYEVIYDENFNQLYSIGNSSGFVPDNELLTSIKENKEVYFYYKNYIEGIGILYKDQHKTIIVIVTGIDSFGIQRVQSLKEILIIGNMIGILLTILSAVFFSDQALKPINQFINQIRKLKGNHISERLTEGNIKDEMTNLAIEFNKLLDRLEHTIEVNNSFVSNTSHELRTPLAAILGTLETSYSYDKDIESIKGSVHSSIEELKKIIELTNGLLNLVQVENKEQQLKLERIDLIDILLESVQVNRKKYAHQNIGIHLGEVEDDAIGYFINGNRYLLITAISNVIDNACKYSNGKNVFITLYIEENCIHLQVKDSGSGVSEKDLVNIFHPLFRGENTKNISGFGIGLALVKRIIDLHSASISISSQVDHGTIVKIIFNHY